MVRRTDGPSTPTTPRVDATPPEVAPGPSTQSSATGLERATTGAPSPPRRNLLGGPALTELKNRVDAGGDHRDLQQLMMHDIDSSDLRAEITRHIAAHSGPPSHGGNLKLLSDIDDTLYANWKDRRYPKGTLYPGVIAFYEAIARSPGADQTNLTFLTARPGDRAGTFEKSSHRSLDKKGVPRRVILSGDLFHLLSRDAMAEKKLKNFEQYAALFPEYEFAFVGDSGQGDAILGAAMLAEHAGTTRAVLIHDIGRPTKTAAERAETRQRGVIYFDTYVGAALEAHDAGLLDRDGLAAVVAAAEPALSQTQIPESTRDLLRRDMARAQAVLGG